MSSGCSCSRSRVKTTMTRRSARGLSLGSRISSPLGTLARLFALVICSATTTTPSVVKGTFDYEPTATILSTKLIPSSVQQTFRVTPDNSSVLEGAEVILKCEINNLAGKVQWAKDGFAYVISPNNQIVGHSRWSISGNKERGVFNLHIKNASLSDDGQYQCQVGPFQRIKAIRTNAQLTVLSPPQAVEISSRSGFSKIEVKAGESVKLECVIRMAKPPASIVWYRGNVQIKGGEMSVVSVPIMDDIIATEEARPKHEKFDTHGSIFITTTAEDDDMSYTCEAKHPAIANVVPMRATAKLSVLYPPGPPFIEGYLDGETLRRGQSVELTCKSRGGNPPAQVVWYKKGEEVKSVYTTEGRTSKNTLTFTAQAHDDKARFTCKVANVMSITPETVSVDLSVLFAPNNVIITGPTEAHAEELVTITCTTDISNPASEVKWVLEMQKLNSSSKTMPASQGGYITTSNITFAINRTAQRAVVVCHAINNKLSETIVGTHTINVIYPPTGLSMTGHNGVKNIVAGKMLKLSCSAISGNPPATITWYKNDIKIDRKLIVNTRPQNAVQSELSMLVNASDNNANIRCEASNSATGILPLVQSVTLKVIFAPDLVKISTKPDVLRAGEQGRLICESTSSNPVADMSWWKNGSPLQGIINDTRPGLYGGFLSRIELPLALTEEMNGEAYTCQAKNSEISRSVHQIHNLSVLYKPIFSNLEANELIGMEGQPFLASVEAKANPSAITYTWSRDGLPVSTSGKRIMGRGPTLNITTLNRQDAGTYICEAMNTQGSTNFLLNLTVQFPAHVVRTSTSGVVYPPGIEAKLFCEIDGSPINSESVTWYREKKLLEINGRYSTFFANKTSFLRIKNPNQEDVGEYSCNVNNRMGNDTSQPILFITHFKPEMKNSPLTKKAAVNKGSFVEMYCKAQASPLPQFVWLFKERVIQSNHSDNKYTFTSSNITELESQSILTVRQVTNEDYGTYECQAQNNMGTAHEYIQLDSVSPPDEPMNLEVINVTHDSVFLSWKRNFDGGLPIDHQIRWKEVGDFEGRYKYQDVPVGEYLTVVRGLSLATTYAFSIRAHNKKGFSNFVPDDLRVMTLRLDEAESLPDVLWERSENPTVRYIYAIAATSVIFFVINVFLMLWFIVRKKNKDRINKSQNADMYAPSTINGDTMTGELSSISDEKSDVNFDANDYVDEGRKTAASTYLIDSTIGDYSKSSLEMQVHQQGTLNRRNNHISACSRPPCLDTIPQKTSPGGTLSGTKSSYIGNPSPAPPSDVNFYSVEMESGHYLGFENNPSPVPVLTADPGSYYPSQTPTPSMLQQHQHPHVLSAHSNTGLLIPMGTGSLQRVRTLPRPVPPPDVTVMTAGTKSPLPPTVPPPPVTFARAVPGPVLSLGHPLSTFTSTPTYSDIDGHLV